MAGTETEAAGLGTKPAPSVKGFAQDIAIAVVALFALATVAALAVWWGVKVFTWMP